MPARAPGGTARRRSPKKTTAARMATCWPEIARTCVMVPKCMESSFGFRVRLSVNGLEGLRFRRVTLG